MLGFLLGSGSQPTATTRCPMTTEVGREGHHVGWGVTTGVTSWAGVKGPHHGDGEATPCGVGGD